MRKLVDEVIYPDAQAREEDGKYPSKSVNDTLAKLNVHAMRLGPGKHLHGLELMGGIVKPEEFDCASAGSVVEGLPLHAPRSLTCVLPRTLSLPTALFQIFTR